ncbi:hypothetical protein [Streptomyces marincola]|uniref:Uncharacterized protein n=1 Tax=Streptomyces marincola TaxID=2878388 RepID=A0A1W7CUF4_9ACTN|nr:hypothetical protein [Streptomyces marincola]ARQ68319.1 hypothetical protein CAG99_05185 [Streptomyces marincola]UCM90651.1 hypothetical protein LC193_23420 [Streptomyces marincola]
MSKKPKSKAGMYISLGTTLFGTVSVVKRLKDARREGDSLQLADAVVSAASIITSVALLARELRRLNEDGSGILPD